MYYWELIVISGLVRSYLALGKIKEALYFAREAMKAMPQSAKAIKLVGDVHASNSGGREKVTFDSYFNSRDYPQKGITILWFSAWKTSL